MVTAQVRGHVTPGRVVIEDKPVGAEQPVYLQSGSVNKSHQIYDNLDGLYSAGQRESAKSINQSIMHFESGLSNKITSGSTGGGE